MADKRRVLIGIPVLLLGGTEVQLRELVRCLIKGGHEVAICCYYEYDDEVVQWFIGDGASVHLMNLVRASKKAGFRDLLVLAKQFYGYLKAQKPDMIHIQYLAPAFVPILASYFANVPVRFATVNIAGRHAYGVKAKILVRAAAGLCTAFFCISKGVEQFWFGEARVFDEVKDRSTLRHFTIYCGIDVASILSTSQTTVSKHLKLALGAKPTIGYVGRLAPQKGLPVLLQAMSILKERIQEIHLVVVGGGPQEVELAHLAEELGVGDLVHWIGPVPPTEGYGMMRQFDVIAMPSLYEGFGLVAAEAQVLGVPVVASDVEGLNEVVEDGATGVLVPPGDPQALASALEGLLKDPEARARLAEAARKSVREKFSIERFERAILRAYEELGRAPS